MRKKRKCAEWIHADVFGSVNINGYTYSSVALIVHGSFTNRKVSVSMQHPLGDIKYLANWVVRKTQCIAKLSCCIVHNCNYFSVSVGKLRKLQRRRAKYCFATYLIKICCSSLYYVVLVKEKILYLSNRYLWIHSKQTSWFLGMEMHSFGKIKFRLNAIYSKTWIAG